MTHRFLYRVQLWGIIAVLWLLPAGLQAQDEYDDSDTTDSIAVAPVLEEQHAAYEQTKHEVEPLSFRQVPDSTANRLKHQKDFAYANDPAYWVKEPEEEPSKGFWDYFNDLAAQGAFRLILYGLLIAFFVFIIYRIMVVNNLFLFKRRSTKIAEVEEGEGDIEDENLDQKIINAVDRKEHRMAVRYMYLKALRLLNDRQWIRFHTQATNYEYVSQMTGKKMAGEFTFLTRIYDYVWYGEFTLNEEQFKLVQNNFQLFYNGVK